MTCVVIILAFTSMMTKCSCVNMAKRKKGYCCPQALSEGQSLRNRLRIFFVPFLFRIRAKHCQHHAQDFSIHVCQLVSSTISYSSLVFYSSRHPFRCTMPPLGNFLVPLHFASLMTYELAQGHEWRMVGVMLVVLSLPTKTRQEFMPLQLLHLTWWPLW